MKTEQFTYLLGAGSSYYKIPTVKSINYAISRFQDLIEPSLFSNSKNHTFLREKIKWLEHEVKLHATIDTFAKKLYLTDEIEKYNELKILLELLFFTWHHSNYHFTEKREYVDASGNKQTQHLRYYKYNYDSDLRYDAFFAQLLKKENGILQFPGNIKILTWNYDIQLEYSLSKFLKQSNLSDVTDKLQILPNGSIENLNKVDYTKMCVLHLNGLFAGEFDIEKNSMDLNHFDFTSIRSYIEADNFFKSYGQSSPIEDQTTKIRDSKYKTGIVFAWENNSYTNQVRTIAKQVAQKTDTLVIIGYSFPYFNRQIDKEIFDNMTHVNRVYLQVATKDFPIVKQRIQSFTRFEDSQIIPILTDEYEFYIPEEYKNPLTIY